MFCFKWDEVIIKFEKGVLIMTVKKILTGLFFSFVILTAINVRAQLPKETDDQKKERMAWWIQDRFGMFIHWGLYAMPARHEWVKRYERMTNEKYEKYKNEVDKLDEESQGKADRPQGALCL